MEQRRILVTVPLEPRHAGLLRQIAPGCEFRFRAPEGVSSGGAFGGQRFSEILDDGPLQDEDAKWAQIIFGNVETEFVKKAADLCWLQTNSAGVESYLAPGVLPEGALLTNASGAYGLAISEHMLGMLLELQKKLHLYREAQKRGEWSSLGAVTSVWGSAVLILGMGDIGGEFGRRCKALGAYVIGVRRTKRPKPDYADEVHSLEQLSTLLPRADVVAITLPGTKDTRNLIGKEQLSQMKPGAILLNVGRGFIVDTQALCDALQSGRLGGAGLDVTEPEPLPPEHRLWQIPNAVITPHISGFYHLKETHERIVGIFAENLGRFLRGEPLRNRVDFSTGYRSL